MHSTAHDLTNASSIDNFVRSRRAATTSAPAPVASRLACAIVLAIAHVALAQSPAWTLRASTGPSPRQLTGLSFDTARGVAVLFGGYGNSGANSDTWEWNGAAWTQRPVGGPSARGYHGAAYDSLRHTTVIFGGYNGVARNAETWEWNGTAWAQRAVAGPAPSARNYPALAFDTARGATVLFGGYVTGNVPNAETWEWNGTTWTVRAVPGPSARYWHAMAYDEARHVCVLFGGDRGGGAYSNETWEWDGVVWSLRATTGPLARGGHAMAYDAIRGVTVLFGGFVNDASTWEWDGTTWSQHIVSSPSARYSTAMTFDAAHGTSLLFGGQRQGGSYTGETWELRGTCTPPVITLQPRAQFACPNGSATFTVAASGSPALQYRWRENGSPINVTSNPSAGTASLVLAATPTDEVFDCVVSNGCGSATSDPATLTVCVADTDDGSGTGSCDGGVTIDDLLYYLAVFEQGSLAADIDDGSGTGTPDGGVTIDDLLYFLIRFEVGC